MRYVTLIEVLELHRMIVQRTGGAMGIRDIGLLESAIAQPRMSFNGEPLYPSDAEKAAALGHAIIMNHPFLDGNKRVGHAAMETFLILNGHQLSADIDEQERIVLAVASGSCSRTNLATWLSQHIVLA
ncbi:MAG: type II toxin-antitoxin system death-on-curing family toxin [Cyanobacteria bacterium J06626_18]